MTPPSKVAEIAGKLTKAQEGALFAAPRIGGNNPGREFMDLCDLGLADCTILGDEDGERWRFDLKPLGLAVRQFIQSQSQEQPS